MLAFPLTAIAGRLRGELRVRMFDAIEKLRLNEGQARVLFEAADETDSEALARCAAVANTIEDSEIRAQFLRSLLPYLREKHADLYARTLAAALEATFEIPYPGNLAEALAALAPELPAQLRSSLLPFILEFEHDEYRRKMLSAFAPFLSADELATVLANGLRINDGVSAGRALLNMSSGLPRAEAIEIQWQCLGIASAVEESGDLLRELGIAADDELIPQTFEAARSLRGRKESKGATR